MSDVVTTEKVDQIFRSGFWMKKIQVLHSIDLSIPEGTVFGFLGANGAGKTTLIQLIVGLREPTAGRVRVSGHAATSREARRKIGYLPERPYFYEHLTGEALLKYFGTLSGMKSSALKDRIAKVLAEVGMAHAGKTELRKYSKGMLQRIGIAQAILHEPPFLVLDEPMSGLDPIGRKEMRELIGRLSAAGHTIFFSTHVIPDVEAICDQVALIQKGRMIGSGPIGHFLNDGGRSAQTEIICSGLDVARARRLPGAVAARAIPEGVRLTVEGREGLNRSLAALVEAQASVVSVTPVRPSLESFFEGEKVQ